MLMKLKKHNSHIVSFSKLEMRKGNSNILYLRKLKKDNVESPKDHKISKKTFWKIIHVCKIKIHCKRHIIVSLLSYKPKEKAKLRKHW